MKNRLDHAMKNLTSILVFILSICFIVALLTTNKSFIYTFLSDAYALHLFALALVLVFIVDYSFRNKSVTNRISYPYALFIAWAIYISFYYMISDSCEAYYSSFLLVNFLIAILLVHLLQANRIETLTLYIPIAILGIVESIIVLLQYVHILTSNSSTFAITGTLENPNITAMLICLSIPAFIEIAQQKRTWKYAVVLLLLLEITAMLVLQCRSALIGGIAIAIIFGLQLLKQNKNGKTLFAKVSIAMICILLAGTLYIVQNKKQASADGRLTIWKITTELISKKPISGYGYGQFEREYNLQQADYFNREFRSEPERMNATYTGMGYNEYLQHLVMGGAIGGLLFTSVILSLLVLGWQNREKYSAALAALTAYAVMSLFNFTVESTPIFLIFIFYTSVLMASNDKQPSIKLFNISRQITLTGSLVALVCVGISLTKYQAQKQLTIATKLLQKNELKQANVILEEIATDISTSEAFYRTKTSAHIMAGEYFEALQTVNKALEYTSTPTTVVLKAQLCEKLEAIENAETYYKVACGIEPHQFKPRALLMEMYLRNGDRLKARSTAQEIVQLKSKFKSEKVAEYKKKAMQVIQKCIVN